MLTMSSHPPVVHSPHTLVIGQDAHGRWLVQDTEGLIEGQFQSRDTALGFARSESEIHHVPVAISETPLTSHLVH
jgi:hypothetical protein